MKNNLNLLKKCLLFTDIEEKNLEYLLTCLSSQEKHFEKNTFIYHAASPITTIGIILSGNIHIVKEDFWGRRMILSQLGSGDLFGETFTCACIDKIPVSVVAAETSDILFINYLQIISSCSPTCDFHEQLIRNMIKILANKNIALTQKIEHITRHTTREKLLSYLSSQAHYAGSNSFSIPFNRQELADYLSIDRSSMSNELSKMRKEGLLKFEHNYFELFV